MELVEHFREIQNEIEENKKFKQSGNEMKLEWDWNDFIAFADTRQWIKKQWIGIFSMLIKLHWDIWYLIDFKYQ